MLLTFLLSLLLWQPALALEQESRLASLFCVYKQPPDFFQSSVTSLESLYHYLVPKSNDDVEIDMETS